MYKRFDAVLVTGSDKSHPHVDVYTHADRNAQQTHELFVLSNIRSVANEKDLPYMYILATVNFVCEWVRNALENDVCGCVSECVCVCTQR